MTIHGCNGEYEAFLAKKRIETRFKGIDPREPHEILFAFQRDIVKWALRRGRACIFSDCGTGKSFMQIEWARQIPGNVLILAPLAVANQTILEAAKLGCVVKYCRSLRSTPTQRVIGTWVTLRVTRNFHGILNSSQINSSG